MGGQVRLTIDATIQSIVEAALDEGRKAVRAKIGFAVVMDTRNAEILALAQSPSFDLNAPFDSPREHRRNHILTSIYEPGSTLKPFVAAIAMDAETLDAEDMIDCGNGAIRIGDHIVRSTHARERLTVRQAVVLSDNICLVRVANTVGAELLYRRLRDFGFGQRTGIVFSKEPRGILRPPSSWGRIGLANVAFGQSISVGYIQLASAFSALVNGGTLIRPTLVAEVRDGAGRLLEKERRGPRIVRNVISAETSRKITEIMVDVTRPGGTGTRGALANYQVAGKTGTTQKAYEDRLGYSSARIASFIGALPAEDPRLVILVVMDEPQGPRSSRSGGRCAAPVFRRIAERTMQYLNIQGRDRVLPLGGVINLVRSDRGDAPARSEKFSKTGEMKNADFDEARVIQTAWR